LEQTRQAGLKQAWDAARQQQALACAFGGWEQRRQAGLQQSWASAQPQQAPAAALTGLEQGRLPWSQQAWPHPETPQQQLRLYTVEGEPAGYSTKWEELHPFSQQLLLQIEYDLRPHSRCSIEGLGVCFQCFVPILGGVYVRVFLISLR
jgi:nucleoporin p58/p45